jgi:hypothetical protein
VSRYRVAHLEAALRGLLRYTMFIPYGQAEVADGFLCKEEAEALLAAASATCAICGEPANPDFGCSGTWVTGDGQIATGVAHDLCASEQDVRRLTERERCLTSIMRELIHHRLHGDYCASPEVWERAEAIVEGSR